MSLDLSGEPPMRHSSRVRNSSKNGSEYAFCVFACQGWWSVSVFGYVKLASFLEEFDAPKMKEKQIDTIKLRK